MTEKEMLEAEKYWCENCCNWDKEEVQMDACSTCKLTGTRVFAQESGKECKCFNVPAENVLVLPCKVGDMVAVRALCECIYKMPNNEECRNECPFEDYCDFDECDNSNEGVFLTKVSRIFNDGYGWKVLFEHCCIEADIKDIGTSFFVGENAKEEAERALKGGEG